MWGAGFLGSECRIQGSEHKISGYDFEFGGFKNLVFRIQVPRVEGPGSRVQQETAWAGRSVAGTLTLNPEP